MKAIMTKRMAPRTTTTKRTMVKMVKTRRVNFDEFNTAISYRKHYSILGDSKASAGKLNSRKATAGASADSGAEESGGDDDEEDDQE